MLCDGSTYDTSKYPKLYKVLGTNVLPNIINRVLWGSNIGGTYLSAGLPNITGHLDVDVSWGHTVGGAFYFGGVVDTVGTDLHGGTAVQRHYIDASRANPIYGRSNTVQPPALTVKYYIKAK